MSDIFMEYSLRQTATYWGNPKTSGWGGETFDAPISISVRWHDRQILFVDYAGNEVKSKAIVLVDRDLDLGGFLYLGTSTNGDPGTVDGAMEIRAFYKTPSMQATQFVRKAWL